MSERNSKLIRKIAKRQGVEKEPRKVRELKRFWKTLSPFSKRILRIHAGSMDLIQS